MRFLHGKNDTVFILAFWLSHCSIRFAFARVLCYLHERVAWVGNHSRNCYSSVAFWCVGGGSRRVAEA